MRKVALPLDGEGGGMVSCAAARDCAIAAPPKIPRAPGGCQSGRVFVKMSGPKSTKGRRARTDSIGASLGLGGGGLMSVPDVE